MQKKYKTEYRKQIAQLLDKGHSRKMIAEKLDTTTKAINGRIRAMIKDGELDDFDGRQVYRGRPRKQNKKNGLMLLSSKKANLSDKAIGLRTAVCPVCKKTFYKTHGKWGWYIQSGATKKDVCTYSCKRKYEREHEPKKKKMVAY